MRTLLIHDYAGHPFQFELSRFFARALSDQGVRVVHAYSASTHTPQASMASSSDGAGNFAVRPLSLGKTIRKYSFVERFRLEREYGRLLEQLCIDEKPDVVLSGNTPTLAQLRLVRHCKRMNVRVVTWIQDMYGVAAHKILRKKIPVAGALAGKYLMHLDGKSYRESNAVIPITEDFEPLLHRFSVLPENITTIHNWAPLAEMPVGSRQNEWATENGLTDSIRFTYAGTLSVRHNPGILLELAKALESKGQGQLLVISEGDAANWLREQGRDLKCLKVLPFQTFERLPQVLASADVLLAILEPDAGVFCVPSKILTYLCAGRALLTSIPAGNLAARLIHDLAVGYNVPDGDTGQLIARAFDLADNEVLRSQMGANARQYAEREFDIRRIANKFACVLELPKC